MYLISVITVLYNAEAYMRPTIDSIVSQKTPEVEYIIIDGGSKDGTLAILENEYKHQIDILVSERDKGLVDAMNKGVRLARGKYIHFKSGGDILLPGSIEKAIPLLKEKSPDVLYGDTLKRWSEDGTQFSRIYSSLEGLRVRSTLDQRTCFILTDWLREHPYDHVLYPRAADYEHFLEGYLHGRTFLHFSHDVCLMEPGGNSDTPKIFAEILHIHKRYFGTLYAWRLYLTNHLKYRFYQAKNRLLRLLLGEEGYSRFKSRKTR